MNLLSQKLKAIADEASDLSKSPVLDYRVRESLVSIALLAGCAGHIQVRIETGEIGQVLTDPNKPRRHD